MAEQHRAKPYVWAAVEKLGKNDLDMLNCVLELRARVEALEAAQPAQSNHPANPDGSLVERVALTLAGPNDDAELWMLDARAAIRAVAKWLREENPLLGGNSSAFASLLERENN